MNSSLDNEASSGCLLSQASASRPGELVEEELPWEEPGLPAVRRKFQLYVPQSYRHGEPTALVFVFHGWGGQGSWYHNWGLGALAESKGFIAVYPLGMADCQQGADCAGFSSWNAVGSSESTDSKMACSLEDQRGNNCYESCRIRKGRCHQCDWTTCYDDVGWIVKLLDALESRFCVDKRRLFAYGCSNGGLFVHELAQSLPERFAAIAATCGGKPHRGWEQDFRKQGPQVSMLLITGRTDHTIPSYTPPKGTSWWDGYRYANESAVVAAYKSYNSCKNSAARTYVTPFTARRMSCMEEGYDCLGGASVVACLFDGGHDLNKGKGADRIEDDPELAWHFFSTHFRTLAVPAEQTAGAQTAGLPSSSTTGLASSNVSSGLDESSSGNPNTDWHFLVVSTDVFAVAMLALCCIMGLCVVYRRKRLRSGAVRLGDENDPAHNDQDGLDLTPVCNGFRNGDASVLGRQDDSSMSNRN